MSHSRQLGMKTFGYRHDSIADFSLYWGHFSIDAISTKNDAIGIVFRYLIRMLAGIALYLIWSLSRVQGLYLWTTRRNRWCLFWSEDGNDVKCAQWIVYDLSQWECEVHSSSLLRISAKVSVEIFVWSLDYVQKITMNFQSLSPSYLKRINQNTFTFFSFLNRSNREEKCLDILLTSSLHPHDQYLLSLTTSASTSSLNTSAMNEYELQLHSNRLLRDQREETRFDTNI